MYCADSDDVSRFRTSNKWQVALDPTLTLLDKDMITMYDAAYKKQPTNEELGAQTFFANVRASNWKSAQQVRNYAVVIGNH